MTAKDAVETDQMSSEDALATAMIQEGSQKPDYHPEVHYNHYGDRGVVDLLVRHGGIDDVYEFKSEYAVKQCTGANSILRQFNKMCEYLYKGSKFERPDRVRFELCFLATESNLRHVHSKNADLYKSALNQSSGTVVKEIVMRTPARPHDKLRLLSDTGFDYRDYCVTDYVKETVWFAPEIEDAVQWVENDLE